MNNKGFAITSFLYAILIVFMVILSVLLINIINTKLSLKRMKDDVRSKIEDSNYVENNSFASIVIDDKEVTINLHDTFDYMSGVYVKRYDGELLQNTISYNSNLDTSKAGVYIVNYYSIINGETYTNHKIVTVLESS